MNKIYSLLAVISIGTLLAGGGLVGYLVGTGSLNATRAEKLVAVIRGELDDWPPTSQPAAASQPIPIEEEPLATSAEEVAAQRRHAHLQGLRLERAKRDVSARDELLRHAQQTLVSQQEAFEERVSRWEAERAKLAEKARDEGFERELGYVNSLSPRLAKEHILRTWEKQPIDAVRLLNGMNPAKGKRILEQFKSPEELQTMHELLEQLRLQAVEPSAGGSGKAADAPA